MLYSVKNSAHRLFVNSSMMKGGETALDEVAEVTIEQTNAKTMKDYPFPKLLTETLAKNGLRAALENLTPSRKKDVLKYLNYLKTDQALNKNIDKLMMQLRNKEKNIRIP